MFACPWPRIRQFSTFYASKESIKAYHRPDFVVRPSAIARALKTAPSEIDYTCLNKSLQDLVSGFTHSREQQKEEQREKTRKRMAKLRQRLKEATLEEQEAARERARLSRARYRAKRDSHSHRPQLREHARNSRARRSALADGLDAHAAKQEGSRIAALQKQGRTRRAVRPRVPRGQGNKTRRPPMSPSPSPDAQDF
ncbi:hypothetical protein C8F04DRAFT_1176790 [Mycena alexandri]|uniref:Uncharacterized protein n=1 Tax=Mycena alexandri TaxID=1745969 RepID=A0AAD6X7B6_9AGAR|nr:hypothetical protein C8F04DRAFT_1176790 [Mycena alexandri]